jgi:hypothetical protein
MQITYLVLGGGLLTEGKDGGHTDSQVVTTDVVDLGLLNQRPDLRLLEVLKLVLVGGSKVGAHAAVVAGDDNTTLASGLGLIDTVLGVDTGLLAGLLEDITEFVLTDTTDVDNGLLGEHVLGTSSISMLDPKSDVLKTYLGTTSGVLSGTTGDQLGIAGKQILVDTHMLLLGEDSIIGLQAILIQESGIATDGVNISDHPLYFKFNHTHELGCLLQACQHCFITMTSQIVFHIPRRGFSRHKRG